MSSLLAILTVLLGVSHANPEHPKAVENRNVAQFGAIILHTVGNPLAYNGYGCWCGKGHRGDLVVDATDRCCQVHDRCWGSAKNEIKRCDAYWRLYKYKKLSNGTVVCKDAVGTCDHRSCMCDKVAAECFARHRKTSYDPDFDNWKGLCTETPQAPEVDPERCPPVWNNREKYARDSLVSIKGIVYQSMESSGPGNDPTASSRGSQVQRLAPVWKKLGRCRWTNTATVF